MNSIHLQTCTSIIAELQNRQSNHFRKWVSIEIFETEFRRTWSGEILCHKSLHGERERVKVLTDQQPEVPSLSSQAPVWAFCLPNSFFATCHKLFCKLCSPEWALYLYSQVSSSLLYLLASFDICSIATFVTRRHVHLIPQVPMYSFWEWGCIYVYYFFLHDSFLPSSQLLLVSMRTTLSLF